MIFLSDDMGAGANKTFGKMGGCQMPARVARCLGNNVGRMEGMKTAKPPMRIKTDRGSFYVGASAHNWGRPIENLDHNRLTGTPEMVALTYASWTQYQIEYEQFGHDDEITIVAGLPIETLSETDAKATASSVKRWMSGRHSWSADGEQFNMNVVDVKVTSQAAGALFDHLLEYDGLVVNGRFGIPNGEIGILSIGFNTVEIMVVDKYHPVSRFTRGNTCGVRRLLELTDENYSLGELDAKLRAGQLDVSEALPVWESEVTGVIENVWGKSWKRFACVLLVGGGAILLRNSLPYRFNGKAIVPDNPVLSIARGLYKMMVVKK